MINRFQPLHPGTPVQLNVLGARTLIGSDGSAATALMAQPKRLALLLFLILDRPFREHERDELLALFWPDHPERNARNALAQAFSFIRRSLHPDLILSTSSGVAVDSTLVSCDAIEFDRAFERGDEQFSLTLYQGDLLPGFHVADAASFGIWLEAERTRLRTRAANGARILTDRAVAANDTIAAVTWASLRVMHDPYDEAATRRLMELHRSAGDRAKAIQAYDRLASRLAGDLELEPSAELLQLMKAIRGIDPE